MRMSVEHSFSILPWVVLCSVEHVEIEPVVFNALRISQIVYRALYLCRLRINTSWLRLATQQQQQQHQRVVKNGKHEGPAEEAKSNK